MFVLVVLCAVACCFFFLRSSKPHLPAPARHFEVRQDDALWVFTVRPKGTSLPAVVLAAIPGAVAAGLATALWILLGHDLDHSSGFFFWAWAIFIALMWAPMRRRAQTKAAGVSFSVGVGGVLLPNEQFLPITGQYVLSRRNDAPYGQGAHAHRVDVDLDGVSYTLASGMSDAQSMTLYHEVGRRLRGDP